MSYKLKKFDPRVLQYNREHGHAPILAFIAKRGCGKSTMIADIVSYLKVNSAIVMSGTEEANGFYSNHIHPLFIYNEFDSQKLADILTMQKLKAKRIKEKFGGTKKITDFPECGILIIMDDLAYDGKMMKDNSLKELFFNGRHYNITLIMAFQYMVSIPPPFRSNIDYVFVGREVTREHMEKLYKYFFGIYPKAVEFRAAFTKYTQDFSYMVLDRMSKSENIPDSVFWYRASLNHRYRIGDETAWITWTKKLKENK